MATGLRGHLTITFKTYVGGSKKPPKHTYVIHKCSLNKMSLRYVCIILIKCYQAFRVFTWHSIRLTHTPWKYSVLQAYFVCIVVVLVNIDIIIESRKKKKKVNENYTDYVNIITQRLTQWLSTEMYKGNFR